MLGASFDSARCIVMSRKMDSVALQLKCVTGGG